MSYATAAKQKPIGSTIRIHKKFVNDVLNDSNSNDAYTPRSCSTDKE